MFPLFPLLFLLSSIPLFIYGQCILLDEQFATNKTHSTAIIAARRMKRATVAFANENNFVQILPPLGQLQKHRRVKRTGFPPPVVPVVPPAPAPAAAPVPAQQFPVPAPSESFFPADFPAPAPAPSQSFFDSNANNQIQPQYQPAQFQSQSNSFSFPSSQSESSAQFQPPPQLALPQPESAPFVPQPNFEPPPAPISPSSEFVPPIQPEPEPEFPLPPPPQQQFPSPPPPSLPPQTTFVPPATSPLPMPTTTGQQSRCELLRYPLPECYTDDSNMMCCNPELEDTMMDAFHQLVQQEGEDEFHRCNIQMIANRVQMMSEAKFNTTFEVITGIGDYASRSHFWHNYICKIERDGRFILAYATPKGNSATLRAVEGNTGGGGEGDEAENGQGGEEEMANYDGEEEGANGGGGMDSESVIHAKRRGPNQGILNMFLALRRRRNEDGKRNKTII